jgi:hypothetical protein
MLPLLFYHVSLLSEKRTKHVRRDKNHIPAGCYVVFRTKEAMERKREYVPTIIFFYKSTLSITSRMVNSVLSMVENYWLVPPWFGCTSSDPPDFL